MANRKRSISNDADIGALHKEWEEASCPICMDHPHNAVLILCSSHGKGCRSYICDTSYRHSNCLDRFRKLRVDNKNSPSPPSMSPGNQDDSTSEGNLGLRTTGNLTEVRRNLLGSHSTASVGLPTGSGENGTARLFEMHEGLLETSDTPSLLDTVEPEETNLGNNLKCPLCRGRVMGWEVVEEARKYLNLRPRCCSRESCSFSGNYRELRRHARRVHPTARPADIEPSREQAWRRLEHQREYGDIVSAIRSAMPGAVVIGDYVIENGDRPSGGRERGSGEVSSPWWTTFFLFQMIGSLDPDAEPRGGRSRPLTRHRRSTGTFSGRRFLWGENLLGLQDDDVDNDDDEHPDVAVLSEMGEDASPNPRRRRRLNRARSDDEQS
ncbi:hypothetical protein RJ639_022175 [Escallonia herrerae]|uniref:Uncharacterized protein n=1 Tax=Escallonia herrerae TaxID=1293975 RepID=A0AA89AHS6_9ASTE|nr:hypothetical protein RJ639_022175 [Escallonia herrerae]